MKKTMKRMKSIVLATAVLVSGFTMGIDVSAATTIQTKMASKPTSMTGTQVWKLTGSSNVPGLTQGACKVGDYLYVGYSGMTDANLNVTTGLRKYNFSTGAVVKTATPDLGHVNDMTYNSKLNKLVVAHSAPVGNEVSIVNMDSLTVEQTYYISKNIYGIEYLADSDTYVVGMAGDEKLVFLNSDFVPVEYTNDTKQYAQATTIGGITVTNESHWPQAINCDGTYIYATWFIPGDYTGTGSNLNYIAVYNMSGTQITQIKSDLTSGREIEGLIVEADTIYGVYGNPGDPQTYLYKYTAANFK